MTGQIFFFDPKNEAFYRRERKNPVGASVFPVLALSLFCAVGAFPAVTGLREQQEIDRFQDAPRAPATLVGARIEDVDDDDDEYYLKYSGRKGNIFFQREQEVTSQEYHRLKDEAVVEVSYLPDGRSRIANAAKLHGWMSYVFSAIWMGVSGSAAFAAFRQRSRVLRLAGARRVFGKVKLAKGATDSDNDFNVDITYELDSPRSGRKLQGTQSSTRNDLGGLLPPIGATVVVLYSSDDDHYML